MSVNFDDSENLFREIVRLDSLIPAQQYHAGGDTARAISNNYGLDEGMGSLLIGFRTDAYSPIILRPNSSTLFLLITERALRVCDGALPSRRRLQGDGCAEGR